MSLQTLLIGRRRTGDQFHASGRSSRHPTLEVVAEMSTAASTMELVLWDLVGAIISANAVPAILPGLRTVPIESLKPIRKPELVW